MTGQRLPALQEFIDGVRAIWSREPDLGSRMERPSRCSSGW